jgi:hypothetical protein
MFGHLLSYAQIGEMKKMIPDSIKQPKDSQILENIPSDIAAIVLNRSIETSFSTALLNLIEPATFTGNPPVSGLQFLSKTFNSNKEWQKKPFMMEADAKLNFQVLSFSKRNFLCNVHFEPRIIVRMFQNDTAQKDESFAVRTPSYFPSGTINFSSKKLWNPSKTINHFFSLKTWHHSDGQDGVDFDEKGWFNTRNGDFADILGNELSYTILKRKVKTMAQSNQTPTSKKRNMVEKSASSTFFWGNIAYEYHWEKWVTGRLTRYDLFGMHRLNLNLGNRKSNVLQAKKYSSETQKYYAIEPAKDVEKFKTTLRISYILDKKYNWGPMENWQPVKQNNLSKRLNCVASFFYHPTKLRYIGLFAQGGYYGSDPYNAYFQQSMWFYKVGISTGVFERGMN